MKTPTTPLCSVLLTIVASAAGLAQAPATPPPAKTTTSPTAAAAKAAPGTKATPTKRPVTHRPAAAGAGAADTAMKLPANIPVVRGVPQTQFALKYIEIKAGTGELAKPGQKYSVHYTGWLHDGTKFDSSVDRGTPIEFVQGAHRVIPGWDEGFDGMKVGGKRRLFIPWQLAYGAMGHPPVIPAKADLIFDIELVGQVDPYAPPPPPKPTTESGTPPADSAPKSATPPQ